MKIIVKCGGRYKNDKKAERFLNYHAGYIDNLLPVLAERLKFRLPSKIVLRPLYYKEFAMMAGRLNYDPDKGFSIALHIDACRNMRNKGQRVVDHECAHLADVLLNKNWGHGKTFKKMYSAACKLRQRRKISRKRKA